MNTYIQLFIIYIITILESTYAFNTNTRIDINTDILFIKGKGNLFDSIINKFRTVISSIVSILLLTIPFYFDNNIPIWLYLLIYYLILIVYIKLRWINKNLNNI